MHYRESEIYFYLKNNLDTAKLREIAAHLGSCGKCRETADKMLSLSSLMRLPLLDAPALDKRIPAGKNIAAPRNRALRSGIAAALAAAAAIVICVFTLSPAATKDKQQNVSNFIYSTYKTMYDFDYYRSSYVDKTDLLAYSEIKK